MKYLQWKKCPLQGWCFGFGAGSVGLELGAFEVRDQLDRDVGVAGVGPVPVVDPLSHYGVVEPVETEVVQPDLPRVVRSL